MSIVWKEDSLNQGSDLGSITHEKITDNNGTTTQIEDQANEKRSGMKARLILIAWMGAIGFDLFYHGGLLANMYAVPNPALLDPWQAFLRIPIGYVSYLVLIVTIYWLLSLNGTKDWKAGFWFGIKFGALSGMASTLGQYSILTLGLNMLILWGLGQAIEFGLIGTILGAGHSTTQMKSLTVKVIMFMSIMLVLMIVLQSVPNSAH